MKTVILSVKDVQRLRTLLGKSEKIKKFNSHKCFPLCENCLPINTLLSSLWNAWYDNRETGKKPTIELSDSMLKICIAALPEKSKDQIVRALRKKL